MSETDYIDSDILCSNVEADELYIFNDKQGFNVPNQRLDTDSENLWPHYAIRTVDNLGTNTIETYDSLRAAEDAYAEKMEQLKEEVAVRRRAEADLGEQRFSFVALRGYSEPLNKDVTSGELDDWSGMTTAVIKSEVV